MAPKYSLIIRWSEEDLCYIAWVPEFGTGVKTHGATYEEAARAGQEVIELLMEPHNDRQPLPEPWLYKDIEPDEQLGRSLFPSNPAYRDPKLSRSPSNVKHATA
jgi:predicted RNase H-like HicB family nuclease